MIFHILLGAVGLKRGILLKDSARHIKRFSRGNIQSVSQAPTHSTNSNGNNIDEAPTNYEVRDKKLTCGEPSQVQDTPCLISYNVDYTEKSEKAISSRVEKLGTVLSRCSRTFCNMGSVCCTEHSQRRNLRLGHQINYYSVPL